MINLPNSHPSIPKPKIGVLIINLGTPEATDYFSMRRYLSEFLSDKRVIEVPSIIWKPILNLFILTFRPRKSGNLYKKIWNHQLNESPLKTITRSQKEKIEKKFKDSVICSWAMRYGKPSIADNFKKMREQGCNKILILPLYPQYSATTTASVMDKVYEVMKSERWQPSLRTVPPYYDNQNYINSLVYSIKEDIKKLKWKPDSLVCTFHGLPKKYFMKGDPYHCHCVKTKRLISEKLNGIFKTVEICFQSRFGPQEWLKPYMNEKFEELIKNNLKKICIIAPGFSSDCVETLEEVNIEGKKDFLEMGGKNYHYIPCLNDSNQSIGMFEKILKDELKGWM